MILVPVKKPSQSNSAVQKYQRIVDRLRIITYAALALGVISILISTTIVFVFGTGLYNVLSSRTIPSNSIANSTGTTNSSLGHTLAGIDQPLNASELAVINSEPNSYFENAGEAYLNGSITNPLFPDANKVAPFISSNRISVVYLGSITCIFCGENRWAMALALSRFGSFSNLFTGYSSLGDSDVPTLYWTQVNYNNSGTAIGNYYSSNIVSFISIEDLNPITGGFKLNSFPQQMLDNIDAYKNQTYINAFDYIVNLSANKTTTFQGTPYTIWGNYQYAGADAEDFGNTTPTGDSVQLTYETHAQVFSQLANPTDQFALTEYAAADIYVASLCKSMNNTASVCSLPAIITIESQLK